MFDWLRQYNFMVLSTPIFMPTVYKFTLKVYVIVSDHKGFGNLQKRKLIHSIVDLGAHYVVVTSCT